MKNYLVRIIVCILLLFNVWNPFSANAQGVSDFLHSSNTGLNYPVYIYACVAAEGVDLSRAKITIIQTKPAVGKVWEKYADSAGDFPVYTAPPVPASAGYYSYTVTITLPDGRAYVNTTVRVRAGVMDPQMLFIVFPNSMAVPFCLVGLNQIELKQEMYFRKPE